MKTIDKLQNENMIKDKKIIFLIKLISIRNNSVNFNNLENKDLIINSKIK
jgi:hypothetical protein